MIAHRLSRLALIPVIALLTLEPHAGALPVAQAAMLHFTVTSTVDAPDAHPGDGVCADAAGRCTLRAAIQEADAQPQGSAIGIRVPAGTYALSLGTLQLTANRIAITGALSSTTIITGADRSTVFAISPGVRAVLRGVTITGGNAGNAAGNGGGILNQGLLVLRQSAVLNNTAPASNPSGNGGGIDNSGTLTVTQSTLSGNTAGSGSSGDGGGIYNSGTLLVTHSTLSGNTAGFSGGGIGNLGGTVTVLACILSGNTAPNFNGGDGGGIGSLGGTLTLINSSLSGNTASSDGGGIWSGSTMTVTTSTLSGNATTFVDGGDGGGIQNQGTLTVTASILSGNAANYGGGGIANENGGTLTMTTSILSRNTASGGGGIINAGNGTVTHSMLSRNTANNGGFGGGIANLDGTLTLTNSAILSNTTIGTGGGIANTGGAMTLSTSTLSGNTASPGQGGGIYNATDPSFGYTASTTLSYVTVAANSDGLVNNSGNTVALTGTLVANSTTGPNCTGTMTEYQGYNLDSGATCGFAQTTDLTNTNPLLGPLAYNGGPTPTMALLPGSPAIDHGGTAASGCPPLDQRGVVRPDAGESQCDMGAYESQGVG